jgi:hypothetical protein
MVTTVLESSVPSPRKMGYASSDVSPSSSSTSAAVSGACAAALRVVLMGERSKVSSCSTMASIVLQSSVPSPREVGTI